MVLAVEKAAGEIPVINSLADWMKQQGINASGLDASCVRRFELSQGSGCEPAAARFFVDMEDGRRYGCHVIKASPGNSGCAFVYPGEAGAYADDAMQVLGVCEINLMPTGELTMIDEYGETSWLFSL